MALAGSSFVRLINNQSTIEFINPVNYSVGPSVCCSVRSTVSQTLRPSFRPIVLRQSVSPTFRPCVGQDGRSVGGWVGGWVGQSLRSAKLQYR